MVISVSRRTDIPAFYSNWFFNRLKEGFACSRNPMNHRQVSVVSLAPDDVDCFVFWTKNPEPMINKISLLSDYHYYFQVTITPYCKDIEPNVPHWHIVTESFIKLSEIIGSGKMVWRYDPILYADGIGMEYHKHFFPEIAGKLSGRTEKCVISFVDEYAKASKRMATAGISGIPGEDMLELCRFISETGKENGMAVESCAEALSLERTGIGHGRCIDDRMVSRITGRQIEYKKDTNQRKECGCMVSKDIGAYNTCGHGCLYCYANYSTDSIEPGLHSHDPLSPFLKDS